MSFFFIKKKCHKIFGPPLCHFGPVTNFLLAPKKKIRASQRLALISGTD